jgi:hypothetical protein
LEGVDDECLSSAVAISFDAAADATPPPCVGGAPESASSSALPLIPTPCAGGASASSSASLLPAVTPGAAPVKKKRKADDTDDVQMDKLSKTPKLAHHKDMFPFLSGVVPSGGKAPLTEIEDMLSWHSSDSEPDKKKKKKKKKNKKDKKHKKDKKRAKADGD